MTKVTSGCRRALQVLIALTLGLLALPTATLLVPALSPAASANGVPLVAGDVLAATGAGLVKNFSPTGTLQDTLDTTTGSGDTTGMCFNTSGDLFVTTLFSNVISEFSPAGNLLNATWATVPSTAESCTVDASNNVYVGGPGAAAIYKFNSTGTLTNTYTVTGGSVTGGTDWVELASDQCTILYTGEGPEIRSFNVCTNTQNPDFATGLPSGRCFELRFRPNGEVIVACSSEAVRLSSAGTVLQTYPITGSSELFAMNLDPDGTTFWTGDIGNGEVSRVDIPTGNILTQFASSPSSELAGLSIVGGIVVGLPTITLTPPTGTANTGTMHTVTATITNPGGSLSGQTVNFSVTGANTASGTGTTNGSGQATFTYTGTNVGSDTITGTFRGATGTANMVWTSPNGCDTGPWPSVVTGYPPVNAIGTSHHPHSPQGVYVGAFGDAWKVYVTHPGAAGQVFTGTITTTNGTLTNVIRLMNEGHDNVTQVNQTTITFRFINRGYKDGVGFTSTCGSQVTISATINGPPAPLTKIFLGPTLTNATSNPLVFTRSS